MTRENEFGEEKEWNALYQLVDDNFEDGAIWRQLYFIIAECRVKTHLTPAETREILVNIIGNDR